MGAFYAFIPGTTAKGGGVYIFAYWNTNNFIKLGMKKSVYDEKFNRTMVPYKKNRMMCVMFFGDRDYATDKEFTYKEFDKMMADEKKKAVAVYDINDKTPAEFAAISKEVLDTRQKYSKKWFEGQAEFIKRLFGDIGKKV